MAESSQSSADEDTASSAGSPSPPKKVQSAKAIEPKAQTHPRTSEMVMQAVKELGERGGSSLFAIKKYINLTYKVDTEKQAHFIKKYLKAAVASGELVQTKGNGANGSFKLSAKAQAAKRKEAKLVEAETAAAEKVPPAKKAAEKKTSKTESAKPSTKKPAPSKVCIHDFSVRQVNYIFFCYCVSYRFSFVLLR